MVGMFYPQACVTVAIASQEELTEFQMQPTYVVLPAMVEVGSVMPMARYEVP